MIKFFHILFWVVVTFSGIAQQNSRESSLDILHYYFDLEFYNNTDRIDGQACVQIQLKSLTDQISLDLVNKSRWFGMTVSEVSINGMATDFTHKEDRVNVRLIKGTWNPGDTIELRIRYSGIPGDGLIISQNKFGTRSFFADNWPNRAHHWIPVVDHPSDKAKVDFLITCPEKYEVIASGKLVEIQKLDGERLRYHFSCKQDLPTKVMVFAASDFRVTVYDTIYGIPVSSWIFEENRTGEMDYLVSVDALRVFTDLIGLYMYDKLVNVQSKTRYGGMENAGNIFYFENSVNGKANFDELIVHEVAHSWFGNAVTEKEWHHIWLSEGFATYLTDLYVEIRNGKEPFINNMEVERKAILSYAKNNPTPVIDERITNLNHLLNVNTYQKGAWILHMLRQKTGDEFFFKILQSFYDQYRFGNALSSDFERIAKEISGMHLEKFFRQWLFYPGNPYLEIKWFEVGDTVYIQVDQMQHTDPFELDLEVLVNEELFRLPIRDKKSVFKILTGQTDHKLVLDPYIRLLFSGTLKKEIFMVPSYAGSVGKSPGNTNSASIFPLNIDSNQHFFLKPGDLLFQDLDCGPLCDAIESVTQGYQGANFSHVGMVTEVRNDSIWVFEAIGGFVKETKLEDFLARSKDQKGRPKVMVGRIMDQTIVKNAVKEVKKFSGKPYDDVFDIDNDSYYCSELLYFSFLEGNQSIFKLYPMTFKSPTTHKYDPAWISYYDHLGAEIPEGKPGLNPGGISRSPYVKILYRFGDPDGYDPMSYTLDSK